MKEGFYELLKSEELEQAIAESGLSEISEKRCRNLSLTNPATAVSA